MVNLAELMGYAVAAGRVAAGEDATDVSGLVLTKDGLVAGEAVATEEGVVAHRLVAAEEGVAEEAIVATEGGAVCAVEQGLVVSKGEQKT